MENKKVLDRVDQMHGATINRMVWISTSGEGSVLSDMLMDMANRTDFNEVLPNIAVVDVYDRNFDHVSLMAESGYLGFLAEIYLPKLSNFQFRPDGSIGSFAIKHGHCMIKFVYTETLEELLDEMERLAKAHFDEAVERAIG